MDIQEKDQEKQLLLVEYNKKRPFFEKMAFSAKADIEAILAQNSIPINKVVGRVKEFDSFFTKYKSMQEKGGDIKDPLSYMQDMVGIRVVLLYVKDLEKIEKLLGPTFTMLKVDKKTSTMPDDQFGYESDHYVLRYNEVKGPQYVEIMRYQFELQVRTILMDAWASVSRHLSYKNSASIPSYLKRVFYGLSGMFVVADKTFQDLKNESEESHDMQMKKVSNPEDLLKQEINLDTLRAYLQYKFPERWKSRDTKYDNGFSELVQEIKELNKYKNLKDLDLAINLVSEYFEKKEKARDNQFHPIGLIRVSLQMYDEEYCQMKLQAMPEIIKEYEVIRKNIAKTDNS